MSHIVSPDFPLSFGSPADAAWRRHSADKELLSRINFKTWSVNVAAAFSFIFNKFLMRRRFRLLSSRGLNNLSGRTVNTLIIIFVPRDVSQSEIKTVLQAQAQPEDLTHAQADRNESAPEQSEALPFWTWFLPNPCE